MPTASRRVIATRILGGRIASALAFVFLRFTVGGMSAKQPEIDLDYVANLARVRLTPAEKAEFSGQLEKILDYFQILREVDVEGVEPMAHAFALDNVWQPDVAVPGFAPSEALANAPASRHDQIVVPKVVDDA